MWGKEQLDVWAFCDLFDEDFRQVWREKVQEYTMPVKDRLYCEYRDSDSGVVCGAFLGRKGLGLVLCSRCQCHTCGDCGLSDESAISAKAHTCKKTTEVDAFEEMQKGQHYQQCPGCEKEIFQAEGCNHMICRPPCGAHFCFVCGKRVAAHQSGHWQQGGCPRFGVSGPRRIWDDPDEHSEDEADASDDDDVEMDLFEHLRDVMIVQQLIDVFTDVERLESDRMEVTRGIAAVSSEQRMRFFGDVVANLNIVDQMMHNTFDVDRIAEQLRGFHERHERVREEYESNRAASASQTDTFTQLSDLSEEFDLYFVFALETMADLNVIAGAQQRTL